MLMLDAASLAFRNIAGKENRDRVQVGTGETACPVIGMIRAGGPEDLRAGCHALTKLLGKRGERFFIDAQRSQTIPGEGDCDPSGTRLACPDISRRANLLADSFYPRPSRCRIAKC